MSEAEEEATKRTVVRFAKTEDDARSVVALGRESFDRTRLSTHSFDETRARALVHKGMEGGAAVLLVVRRGAEDVGFVAGQIGAALFSAARTATVVAFYVRPSVLNGEAAVKLMQAFRNWAKAAKADEIQLHVTSGVRMAETDRFMRRLGFRQTGGNYVQEL